MKRILLFVVTAVWSACVMSAGSDEVSNGSFYGKVILVNSLHMIGRIPIAPEQ